ncbi:MAG: LysR family transcriptional regulator [Actinomycetota bacterium]|nr:LysR family transcriptional regulator [Actinomycetota bacterium]
MTLPPRTPELKSLDLLLTVAELGSLGRAARRHGVSQPAVSAQIAQLERQLGVRLLERSASGSRLTPIGSAVVDWSSKVVGAAATLMTGVAALRDHSSGHLRIAASLTVSEHLMPVWLVALRSPDPNLSVSLTVANSAAVVSMVSSAEVELGIVEGPVPTVGLSSRVLGRDRLTVVVSPRHPWARKHSPLPASVLAGTPLILREAGSGTRMVLEHALAPFGGVAPPLMELGSTVAISRALQRGDGAAVLGSLATRDDLDAGRLVEVPVDGADFTRELRAVWRGDELLGLAARFLAVAGRIGTGAQPSERR